MLLGLFLKQCPANSSLKGSVYPDLTVKIQDYEERIFYICDPPRMVQAMKKCWGSFGPQRSVLRSRTFQGISREIRSASHRICPILPGCPGLPDRVIPWYRRLSHFLQNVEPLKSVSLMLFEKCITQVGRPQCPTPKVWPSS